MLKREIDRVYLKVQKVLEPFVIIAIAIVIIIPALAVINLSPKTRASSRNAHVLGVGSEGSIGLALVGGTHEIFKSEKLQFENNSYYSYTSTLLSRNEGVYSKPILQANNKNTETLGLEIRGGVETPIDSKIRLIVNDQSYLLQDRDGESFNQTVFIESGKMINIYLSIESYSDVSFEQDIVLQLLIQDK